MPVSQTTLTEDQVSTLRNALVTAADRYDGIAKDFATIDGYQQLDAQFTRQAKQVRDLIEVFDGSDDATDVLIRVVEEFI